MTSPAPIRPGLCSVTLRQLSADAVVALAKKAGLCGIEWGADIHVPAGQLETAREVATLCRENGLATPSYGSYVRAGAQDEQQDFSSVLQTAKALGAANIRVWAGTKGSAQSSPEDREKVARALRIYAQQAADSGITLSLEYHPDTLTDTIASSLALVDDIDHPNCFSYWQPGAEPAVGESVDEVCALSNKLSHFHVFHWSRGNVRRPLQQGADFWSDIFAVAPGGSWQLDRFAFLEFVVDDDPQQLLDDAKVMQRLLAAPAGLNNHNSKEDGRMEC